LPLSNGQVPHSTYFIGMELSFQGVFSYFE
jgi:hypothetical protein